MDAQKYQKKRPALGIERGPQQSVLRVWVSATLALASIISAAQIEDPCKTKSRVVADDKYCDKYWECDNGQSVQYDCPNGLVFAGKHRGVTEGCDYPWRSNYCEYPKVQINPPIGTEHCDWLYGIFGHETSCTRYWTCWNGTATEQLCIGGLLYNEQAHSCDWPENVDGCQKHRELQMRCQPRGLKWDTSSASNFTGCLTLHAETQQCKHCCFTAGLASKMVVAIRADLAQALCNEDPNGNVPLGKSCNRYWQCQGGYPRLQRCPAMLVFDRRSLRCVVPPTEECDVPTTTAPPPEEEEPRERPQVWMEVSRRVQGGLDLMAAIHRTNRRGQARTSPTSTKNKHSSALGPETKKKACNEDWLEIRSKD
ncbi:hypothetical protein MSG28_000155 [Choristoneura fumiferana]|uniref:Uncharacterized protein n=1 Tax=Choristoneura fumiferana TaxID=7141 RepID=A0ACC0JZB4_CHOFU|nr:hypothetical protein MSG28_000155 [Choristoneura fumiferana]